MPEEIQTARIEQPPLPDIIKTTSVVSEIGPRPKMEDRHVLEIVQGGLYGGVYDGHGGVAVADHAAQNMHRLFGGYLEKGMSPQDAFRHVYEDIDAGVADEECGATSGTFYIRARTVTYANVGDARIVLVGKNGAAALTRDHRLTNEGERSRVEAAGAETSGPYIMRGDRGLMPTRSLGDHWFRPVGVIPIPEVGARMIHQDDRFLITACDGLWDIMSLEEVAGHVQDAANARDAVQRLRQMAVGFDLADNLTIVVVEFATS